MKKTYIAVSIIVIVLSSSLAIYYLHSNRQEHIGQRGYEMVILDGISEYYLENITDVAFQGNTLWVGTTRGLYHLDENFEELARYDVANGLVDNIVTCLALDRDNLWIGTPQGITMFNTTSQTWVNFSVEDGLAGPSIRCIVIGDKEIWAGSDGPFYEFGPDYGGICKYSKENQTWTAYNWTNGNLLHMLHLRTIALDGDKLWIGSERGLTYFDTREERQYSWDWKETFTWRPIDEYGLSSNGTFPHSIVTNDRYVWMGNGPYPVELYDKTFGTWGKLEHLNEIDELEIRDIVVDGKFLFLSSNQGIIVHNNEVNKYEIFGEESGLISISTGMLKLHNGQLWVGSTVGINVLNINIEVVYKND